ncbi:MAG: hypothetical protein WD989_01375 [Candidatus Paceibacterota bacterium]
MARDLVGKVGPEESINLLNKIQQNDLKYFQMSEIHLLMHVIGEETYKKYGQEAVLMCQDDMLNGCMHGVMLSVFADNGFEGIKNIIESCRSQPPYKFRIRCVHGAGHGFLVASNYRDLPGALKMCDSIENIKEKDLESCYYAVFMENVSGEHDGLVPESHPWLDKDDLFYPCNAVDTRYRDQCYQTQPSWWYQNLRDIRKTAGLCHNAPPENQEACAAGVALLLHVRNKSYEVDTVLNDCGTYFKNDKFFDACLLITSRAGLARYEFDFARGLCKNIKAEDTQKECHENIQEFLSL